MADDFRFTTVVGCDAEHLPELRAAWPTWRKYRREIWDNPVVLLVDHAARPSVLSQAAAVVADHPDVTFADTAALGHLANRRERMLSAFVLVAPDMVTTPKYLKIDTDAVAFARRPGGWLKREWFADGVAVAASPWGYTKPAAALAKLTAWGDRASPAFAAAGPKIPAPPAGSDRIRHPRWTGWLMVADTVWTRRQADRCGRKSPRLPVPSQDTFLWYCGAREGATMVREPMARYGWVHVGRKAEVPRVAGRAMRGEMA